MAANVAIAGYDQHERFNEFTKELEAEHGIKPEQAKIWLSKAERLESVLTAISRPAEKTKTWADYRKIFLTEKRIEQG